MCVLGYLFLSVTVGKVTNFLDCKWLRIQTWLVYLRFSGAMFSVILLNRLKRLATQIWFTGLHPSFFKSAKALVLLSSFRIIKSCTSLLEFEKDVQLISAGYNCPISLHNTQESV